jgi:ATP-dependent DNA helicase RecG
MDINAQVATLPYVGSIYAKRLAKLEIKSIKDLLYHVPFRYDDLREITKIGSFPIGETKTVKAEIVGFKNQYTNGGKAIQVAEIYDGTGKINCIWFNQRYLSRSLPVGTAAYFAGELTWWRKNKAIYSPDFEIFTPGKTPLHTGRLVPIYHETYGISSKWLRNRIYSLIQNLIEEDVLETMPDEIMKQNNLMRVLQSLKTIHLPNSPEEAESARKRLALDELLILQLENKFRKIKWQENDLAHEFKINDNHINDFINGLPFSLTRAQAKVIVEILDDLKKDTPMNRLLEGDVGSGKTVVAAVAAFAAFKNGLQTAIMAPTQILAAQHQKTLSDLFSKYKIKVGNKKDDDVIVATHALIHKNIKLATVGLVVIDEQHRFGVEQRTHLVDKSTKDKKVPHVLTMTATPIPRTVAKTLYGELDLSILDELPKNRQKVTTWVVPPEKREAGYDWIAKQIDTKKAQVFVVCPLIEDSESESLQDVKSAKAEYEKLVKIFSRHKVGLLHGKMKTTEKDEILQKFRDKKIDILVSTPVVEVGVDIPDATIMLIEAADRFGLASLHQLRGRVGRGDKKSYCMLLTENKNPKVVERLNALKTHHSGFELAEIDLELRGPGEILGNRQSGLSNLKIASWRDIDLITLSRHLATEVVENPQNFAKLLESIKKAAHN